jgi:uncharacterized circularly permuted ATP-grasp superfamily protein
VRWLQTAEEWHFLEVRLFYFQLAGDPKHTFDIVNVTRLNKDYAALVEGVVQRIRVMELQIGTILSDRELFDLAAIFISSLPASPSDRRKSS